MKTIFRAMLFCICITAYSQEKEIKPFSVEASYFYGNIFEHNKNIGHLITGHPEGFTLSYNNKTYGFNEAERQYGYPDWGFTFMYQDMKNEFLGDHYGLYGHYTWYMFRRHFKISIGTGIAYNTNPYDIDTNFTGNAYGTSLLSSTYLKTGYVYENLWNGFGISAGLIFIHYSNGNLKAPNTSTNTYAVNLGISYQFDHENFPEYIPLEDEPNHEEPLKFNFAFRYGFNESDVVGFGQYPFYVFSGFIDKRINYKSTLQAGTDVFLSNFLKDYLLYRAVAFPEDELSGDEDYKRVGVFVGHELRFNKVAFASQLGYYVYWPSKFETRFYNRLALKRYFFNDKIFGLISVKSHWSKAEAIEFGVGVRL